MNRISHLLPKEKIVDFCLKWQIDELAVFGSILRDDFGPESDIDLLIAFSPDAEWSLFDHIQMQNELEGLLERSVDLISKRALESSQNWIRRKEILQAAQTYFSVDEVLYAT